MKPTASVTLQESPTLKAPRGRRSITIAPTLSTVPILRADSDDRSFWHIFEPWVRLLIVVIAIALAPIAISRLFSASVFSGSIRWEPGNLPRLLISAYGLVLFAALVWRVRLWRRYRPVAAVADEQLPHLSLVIPAFNEGKLVGHCIRAAAASRYPADRFEIIVIDDGSTDDTGRHILAAVREAGDRVRITTVRHETNRGKRQALHSGFLRAQGEVWATTDSDSLLDRDALRNAVAPIVRDGRVNCVSGCVQALNAGVNLFTRFMKCYYSLSFKFVRAYQDGFRGVFCAPGALSVYRASATRPVLDEWIGQAFLGVPCATGEDRAMTNLLLREGGMTAYQQSAVVWSRAPETYGDMSKMFLRWARSNIRETIVLWRFLLTRFREGSLAAFRFNMALVLLSLVLTPIFIGHSLGLMFVSDGFVLRYAAAAMFYSGILAAIYYLNERDADWVWLLIYQLFSIACLSWIMPYAAVTLRNTGWLTRGARLHLPAERDVVVEALSVDGLKLA